MFAQHIAVEEHFIPAGKCVPQRSTQVSAGQALKLVSIKVVNGHFRSGRVCSAEDVEEAVIQRALDVLRHREFPHKAGFAAVQIKSV